MKYFILVNCLFFLLLFNCGGGVSVKLSGKIHSISITPKGVNISTDSTILLEVDIVYDSGLLSFNQVSSIDWKIVDTSVANIDSFGVLSSRSAGQTLIVATSNFDETKIDFLTVTVFAPVIPVTGLSIDNKPLGSDTLVFLNSQPIQLSTSITPNNATDQLVTWSSEPANKVDQQGNVSFVREGNLKVKASISNFSDSVNFNIVPASIDSVIIFNKPTGSDLYRLSSDILELTSQVLPSISNQTVVWESEPEGYVNAIGQVWFGTIGTLKVRVMAANKSDSVVFFVSDRNIEVDSIKAVLDTVRLAKGTPFVISYQTYPDPSIAFFNSLDTNIVQVTSNNSVIAKNEGIASVVLSVQADISKMDTVVFVIHIDQYPVTSFSIFESGIDVNKSIFDSSLVLSARVLPDTATNRNVVWSSIPAGQVINLPPATVSGDTSSIQGQVSFNAIGDLKVIATSLGGNFSDTLFFMVSPISLIGVQIDALDSIQFFGDTLYLTGQSIPFNATESTLEWSSSLGILTFDNGVVVLDQIGSYEIYLTSSSPNNFSSFTDTVKVDVIYRPSDSIISVQILPLAVNTSISFSEVQLYDFLFTVYPDSHFFNFSQQTSSVTDNQASVLFDGDFSNRYVGTSTNTSATATTKSLIKHNVSSIRVYPALSEFNSNDFKRGFKLILTFGDNSTYTFNANDVSFVKPEGYYSFSPNFNQSSKIGGGMSHFLQDPLVDSLQITTRSGFLMGNSNAFHQFSYTINSQFTNDTGVIWSSLDPSILSVQDPSLGLFFVKKEGQAFVTVTSKLDNSLVDTALFRGVGFLDFLKGAVNNIKIEAINPLDSLNLAEVQLVNANNFIVGEYHNFEDNNIVNGNGAINLFDNNVNTSGLSYPTSSFFSADVLNTVSSDLNKIRVFSLSENTFSGGYNDTLFAKGFKITISFNNGTQYVFQDGGFDTASIDAGIAYVFPPNFTSNSQIGGGSIEVLEPSIISLEITGELEVPLLISTTLQANVVQQLGASTEVTWQSNDANIATIDANGVVTTKNFGFTQIIATSRFNPLFADTVIFQVLALEFLVSQMIIEPLNAGDSMVISEVILFDENDMPYPRTVYTEFYRQTATTSNNVVLDLFDNDTATYFEGIGNNTRIEVEISNLVKFNISKLQIVAAPSVVFDEEQFRIPLKITLLSPDNIPTTYEFIANDIGYTASSGTYTFTPKFGNLIDSGGGITNPIVAPSVESIRLLLPNQIPLESQTQANVQLSSKGGAVKTFSFINSDTNIVRINSQGLISPISIGNVSIVVFADADHTQFHKANIKVVSLNQVLKVQLSNYTGNFKTSQMQLIDSNHNILPANTYTDFYTNNSNKDFGRLLVSNGDLQLNNAYVGSDLEKVLKSDIQQIRLYTPVSIQSNNLNHFNNGFEITFQLANGQSYEFRANNLGALFTGGYYQFTPDFTQSLQINTGLFVPFSNNIPSAIKIKGVESATSGDEFFLYAKDANDTSKSVFVEWSELGLSSTDTSLLVRMGSNDIQVVAASRLDPTIKDTITIKYLNPSQDTILKLAFYKIGETPLEFERITFIDFKDEIYNPIGNLFSPNDFNTELEFNTEFSLSLSGDSIVAPIQSLKFNISKIRVYAPESNFEASLFDSGFIFVATLNNHLLDTVVAINLGYTIAGGYYEFTPNYTVGVDSLTTANVTPNVSNQVKQFRIESRNAGDPLLISSIFFTDIDNQMYNSDSLSIINKFDGGETGISYWEGNLEGFEAEALTVRVNALSSNFDAESFSEQQHCIFVVCDGTSNNFDAESFSRGFIFTLTLQNDSSYQFIANDVGVILSTGYYQFTLNFEQSVDSGGGISSPLAKDFISRIRIEAISSPLGASTLALEEIQLLGGDRLYPNSNYNNYNSENWVCYPVQTLFNGIKTDVWGGSYFYCCCLRAS